MAEKLGVFASLEPLKKGDQFDKFPLHVTLMPWFDMPHERSFINYIQNLAAHTAPVEIEGGEEALFGPDKEVRVRKLARAGTLYAMHNTLHTTVKKLDGTVRESSYVGEAYVPNVTYQCDRGLDEGEKLILDRIQLIRGATDGPRSVVADLGLSKKIL